ncbi:unnamed protein product [Phyllotreta striolata]|uniref:Carboxylic ester hydrolase n=1 Tax=Phyllotreta striolata TaxID=444603 RepID=A0A9P0DQT6_PHYSR|nr:unnamed protein product [Phyllotreta striolata]
MLRFFNVLLIAIFFSKTRANVVEISEGTIRGHELKSAKGNSYYGYQDIPYAAPPTGDRRFKDPVEPEKWSGIRDATKNEKICFQVVPTLAGLNQTEDCLYLNVYTPVKTVRNNTSLLPVLLWIHGGGFFLQAGSLGYYNPRYLMDYDVIFVTPNYRLGVFGLLATSDGVIPGNRSLKDLLMAIRWVNKNIHRFGGDKNRLTVMGASSGAISAGYLQLSPLTKGLVRGYIMGGGSPFAMMGFQSQPDHYAFKLARTLDKNFQSNDTKDVLDLLMRARAEDILYAPVLNDYYNLTLAAGLVWQPTIEPKSYENAFISEPMVEAMTKGHFQQVPLLMGTVDEEAFNLLPTLSFLMEEATKYDTGVKSLLHPDLHVPTELAEEANQLYKSVYTNGTLRENSRQFMQLLGEDTISTPTIHYAVLASKYTPVYFWQFRYRGLMGRGYPIVKRAGHAEQILYLFGGVSGMRGDSRDYPEDDQVTVSRMLTIWTNFAKYGNPTPKPLEGITWPKFKEDSMEFVDINDNLTIKNNPKKYRDVRKVIEKYSRPPYYVF